jgi:hypothetical protein
MKIPLAVAVSTASSPVLSGDRVDGQLGLDLVEQVEVHLQARDPRSGRADRQLGRGRRRLARQERGGRAVAGVALDAEQALDGQRRRAAESGRGDRLLRGLGRGSFRGVLAHR